MSTIIHGQKDWDRLATAYAEHLTDHNMSLAEEALSRLDLGPESRLLDIASGSGAVSIPAARAGADVTAVDLSPAMIEQLLRRARAEGLSNIQGEAMDGQALELEDDTFDVAASQFGVMLFPDLQRGLSEMVRVTKPGGKVLVVAFGPFPEVEFVSFFLQGVRSANPDAPGPPPNQPLPPFRLADPSRMRREMVTAGLSDVHIDTINHHVPFKSARDLWETTSVSNPIGAGAAAGLTDQQVQIGLQTIETLLQRRMSNGVAMTNNTINIGIGTA